jgi:hypothetical protein
LNSWIGMADRVGFYSQSGEQIQNQGQTAFGLPFRLSKKRNFTGHGGGKRGVQYHQRLSPRNLTIDSVNLEMTTTGHSALRIGRDLVIQNSKITTKDSGDGGDFYVSRFIRFSDSTIDMSGINVEYPSIYLDNTYCPAELKVSPAVVIEDSDLKIGGQKNAISDSYSMW